MLCNLTSQNLSGGNINLNTLLLVIGLFLCKTCISSDVFKSLCRFSNNEVYILKSIICLSMTKHRINFSYKFRISFSITVSELILQCFDTVGWATGRAPGLQKFLASNPLHENQDEAS